MTDGYTLALKFRLNVSAETRPTGRYTLHRSQLAVPANPAAADPQQPVTFFLRITPF